MIRVLDLGLGFEVLLSDIARSWVLSASAIPAMLREIFLAHQTELIQVQVSEAVRPTSSQNPEPVS